MNLRGLALTFVLSAASATAINAVETVTGRWAVDESACTRWSGTAAESALIVSENALRWSSDACRIERTYKAGDTVHIQAMCSGDAGEKLIPVSLRPRGEKLLVTWDRASRGELRRCP
jgi:hypothetical protein